VILAVSSADNVIGLIVAILLAVFLVAALLLPERF
jgi:K+-transporting ATPase KdpF subunit